MASRAKPKPRRPSPKKREKAAKIAVQLHELYPDPEVPLDHTSPFTLLVAVMLSAQTTDKKVNEITPELFARANDAASLSQVPVDEIKNLIRQIGLAPTKAKNLRRMAELLLERHDGEVPDSLDALEDLPGVGHKTASVVMVQAFGVPAFPVDTHIHRLAQRWGLSNGSTVVRTEQDLKALYPEDEWEFLHLAMILCGREHCPARSHTSEDCPVCSWTS
jgi:endonuclease-3